MSGQRLGVCGGRSGVCAAVQACMASGLGACVEGCACLPASSSSPFSHLPSCHTSGLRWLVHAARPAACCCSSSSLPFGPPLPPPPDFVDNNRRETGLWWRQFRSAALLTVPVFMSEPRHSQCCILPFQSVCHAMLSHAFAAPRLAAPLPRRAMPAAAPAALPATPRTCACAPLPNPKLKPARRAATHPAAVAMVMPHFGCMRWMYHMMVGGFPIDQIAKCLLVSPSSGSGSGVRCSGGGTHTCCRAWGGGCACSWHLQPSGACTAGVHGSQAPRSVLPPPAACRPRPSSSSSAGASTAAPTWRCAPAGERAPPCSNAAHAEERLHATVVVHAREPSLGWQRPCPPPLSPACAALLPCCQPMPPHGHRHVLNAGPTWMCWSAWAPTHPTSTPSSPCYTTISW